MSEPLPRAVQWAAGTTVGIAAQHEIDPAAEHGVDPAGCGRGIRRRTGEHVHPLLLDQPGHHDDDRPLSGETEPGGDPLLELGQPAGVTAEQVEKMLKEMNLTLDERAVIDVENGVTRKISETTHHVVSARGHALTKHQVKTVVVTPVS